MGTRLKTKINFAASLFMTFALLFVVASSSVAPTIAEVAEGWTVSQREAYDNMIVEETKKVQHYIDAPVYDWDWASAELLPGEVKVTDKQRLFQGSWYAKHVSSMDPMWRGIEQVVTLPEVTYDLGGEGTRIRPTGGKFLDNPSIYMGATGIRESDVGLVYEIISEDMDETNPAISGQSHAFRPFWRYIDSANANVYRNADKFAYDSYYMPGDTVRMMLVGVGPNLVKFYTELVSPTTIPKYINLRARFDVQERAMKFITYEDFNSPGLMTGAALSFKHVAAVDQAGNEGKPTIPSNIQVLGNVYNEAYIFREINGQIYRVPFSANRYNSFHSPVKEGFRIYPNHSDESWEDPNFVHTLENLMYGYRTVDITPGYAVDYKPNV